MFTLNPHLFRKLSDSMADFTPVVDLAQLQMVLSGVKVLGGIGGQVLPNAGKPPMPNSSRHPASDSTRRTP
ncbi:hypothetical protein [Pseudorhodoferax sp. Leaf274]|uniref:hypothetical protein n=1 Tax=Pseudorhodoferax sp. Leaf274 TaxID=1736318 RepID=UPI000AB15894|nr:hypothetical protein [Pseudorhodoferax sp. Leaf274]